MPFASAPAQSVHRAFFPQAFSIALTAVLTFGLLLGLAPSSASAQSTYERQVQQMYVAYYGRPGDPAGVDYWAGRLAEVGGNWIADLVSAFGDSAEYIARFGALDNQTLVNNLFLGLFNRSADDMGLAFYVDLLNGSNLSGSNPELRQSTLAQIALDIVNGVQPSTDDAITINNKLDVAGYFTNVIRSSGRAYNDDLIPLAVAILNEVNYQSSSVSEAKQRITSRIESLDVDGQYALERSSIYFVNGLLMDTASNFSAQGSMTVANNFASQSLAMTFNGQTETSTQERTFQDIGHALSLPNQWPIVILQRSPLLMTMALSQAEGVGFAEVDQWRRVSSAGDSVIQNIPANNSLRNYEMEADSNPSSWSAFAGIAKLLEEVNLDISHDVAEAYGSARNAPLNTFATIAESLDGQYALERSSIYFVNGLLMDTASNFSAQGSMTVANNFASQTLAMTFNGQTETSTQEGTFQDIGHALSLPNQWPIVILQRSPLLMTMVLSQAEGVGFAEVDQWRRVSAEGGSVTDNDPMERKASSFGSQNIINCGKPASFTQMGGDIGAMLSNCGASAYMQ